MAPVDVERNAVDGDDLVEALRQPDQTDVVVGRRCSFGRLNGLDGQWIFSHAECETLLREFVSPRLFEKGMICRADDRGDPVVQISPPLIATQKEFDEIAGTLGEVLSEAWQRIT